MRKAQSIAARKEQHWAWLMVAPTIIGLLVLNYYPLIETFILSFSKTKTFGASTFNGIDNYIQMFQSPSSGKLPGTPSSSVSSPCLWASSWPCWWLCCSMPR